MTSLHDQARALLQERILVLMRREGAISHHLRNEDGRLDADFADRVNFTSGDEVLEALDDAGRVELTELHAAVRRLDDGTWGKCTSCGGTINPGRLAALPEAALCSECARR